MSKPEDIHAVSAELLTETGFYIPDPDQGVRFVQLLVSNYQLAMVNVWEPWESGDYSRGDNLPGFMERYERWIASDVPSLHFIDPRFGYDHYMQRGLIPHVLDIGIGIHRREDARAMVRKRAVEIGPEGLPIVRRAA